MASLPTSKIVEYSSNRAILSRQRSRPGPRHTAGEVVSRLNYDRNPIAALALSTDTSVLTAIGNDYGYKQVFARQIIALGHPDDVFIPISTSGRSANILRAIETARSRCLVVVGFTRRSGGEMRLRCDFCLHAPSDSTQLFQQLHITAAHIICGSSKSDCSRKTDPADPDDQLPGLHSPHRRLRKKRFSTGGWSIPADTGLRPSSCRQCLRAESTQKVHRTRAYDAAGIVVWAGAEVSVEPAPADTGGVRWYACFGLEYDASDRPASRSATAWRAARLSHGGFPN
jgi:phosphoheptose isomerase